MTLTADRDDTMFHDIGQNLVRECIRNQRDVTKKMCYLCLREVSTERKCKSLSKGIVHYTLQVLAMICKNYILKITRIMGKCCKEELCIFKVSLRDEGVSVLISILSTNWFMSNFD